MDAVWKAKERLTESLVCMYLLWLIQRRTLILCVFASLSRSRAEVGDRSCCVNVQSGMLPLLSRVTHTQTCCCSSDTGCHNDSKEVCAETGNPHIT